MGRRGPKVKKKNMIRLHDSWQGRKLGAPIEGDTKRPWRPAWLKGEGRKEWERVAPKLYKEGLLTELDRVPLAMYCQAYGDYLEALALSTSPMIKTTNGNIIQNPAVGIANQAWKRCLNTASRFGMTPGDRQNVRTVEKPSEGNAKSKFFRGAG